MNSRTPRAIRYDLLRTLTQDWSSGDGRTLFLVGDPMQSIYGFRNAEVGRFSTVRAAGLAGLAAHGAGTAPQFPLGAGRWCTGATTVFARVFPAADDVRRSAVRHLASVAGANAQLDGEPRIYRVEGDRLRARRSRHGGAISSRNSSATRPGESIAVLAGARPHLRAIREASGESRACPSSA